MKFLQPISLNELCSKFNLDFIGNPNLSVHGINEIHRVENGDIIFVDNKKYFEKALISKASVIIINEEITETKGKSLIIHPNPFFIFNEITKHFHELHQKKFEENVIDESAIIYPTTNIGKNVKIGKNSIIHHGVYIGNDVVIGNNVTIGPNSVIGHYAFYYKATGGQHNRMLTCGGIIIEDEVEIGALCSID